MRAYPKRLMLPKADIPAKIFCSQIMSYLCEKRVENYPDFEKLASVFQHGLQGFTVKNIDGESTEANDLSHSM